MIFFYAVGGGLGHLNRVSVFIRQFKIESFKVITGHPQSDLFFHKKDVISVPSALAEDRKGLADFLAAEISTHNVSAFYIDTFPAGLLGELPLLNNISFPVFYLARRLRWKQYAGLVHLLPYRFFKTFLLETLEPLHLQFIAENTDEAVTLRLNYPEPEPSRIQLSLVPPDKPLWLIVHSSDKEEVQLLHDHAVEIAAIEGVNPFLVVLSDQKIEVGNGICMKYFPATDWFVSAERIFTAAGFNIIQQIRQFRHKHICIPFPRRFDDQSWRASNID